LFNHPNANIMRKESKFDSGFNVFITNCSKLENEERTETFLSGINSTEAKASDLLHF